MVTTAKPACWPGITGQSLERTAHPVSLSLATVKIGCGVWTFFDVTEVKTVPYVPLSHPFIERLFGTVRRKYLDQAPFLSARDLDTNRPILAPQRPPSAKKLTLKCWIWANFRWIRKALS